LKTGKHGNQKRPLKNNNYTIKEFKTISEDAKKDYAVQLVKTLNKSMQYIETIEYGVKAK
jgi:hypothetical protein